MTKAEAYELALMQVELSHELGEAASRSAEFWTSASYILLVIAFIAPKALNKATTPIILTLYILMTLSFVTNAEYDQDTANAAMRDAEALVVDHELSLQVVSEKKRFTDDPELNLRQSIAGWSGPGIFLATIGYVCFVSYRNWRIGRLDSPD
ncbi:MAG: hypothetical protein ABJ056_10460 [Halioglobus sp.]